MTIDGTVAGPPAPALSYWRRARTPRWVFALAAGWALVVAGTAVYAVFHGRPTVREQTTIAQALPTVDRAVGELVAAARGSSAVPVIGGYVRTETCEVTPVRAGARYERAVEFFTAPGTEGALVTQLVNRLPKSYHAHGAPLRADAGNYVAVRGGTTGTGRVRVVADTGCRPQDRPVPAPERYDASGAGLPPEAVPAQRSLAEVVAALRVADWPREAQRVPCPGGAPAWTLAVNGPVGSAPPSLADTLRGTAPAPVLAERDGYAYRSGSVGVVVRTVDGAVVASATVGCG